jgi:hypothetical protein
MIAEGRKEVQVCDAREAEIHAAAGFQTKKGKEVYKKYLCSKFFIT